MALPELACLYKVSPGTAVHWVCNGVQVTAIRAGKVVRFRLSEEPWPCPNGNLKFFKLIVLSLLKSRFGE